MAARGTRRPHPRRVRSKPMRRVSKGASSSGCLLMVLALAAVPALGWLATALR
jgi:hypothetical protein